MPATADTTTFLRRLPCLGGVELLQASYRQQHFARHFHEGYALGVIDHGALAFRYQGQDMVATRHEVNLVVPGEVHDGHGADDRGWAYRMFYFPPEALKTAAAALELPPGLPDFAAGVLSDPELAHQISRSFALLTTAHEQLARESILLTLLCNWISRHAEQKPPAAIRQDSHAILRAKEFLHAHSYKDVTLENLAQTACLSPYHLIRTFQQSTGLTPHAYLMQLRVQQARKALCGGAPLANVAADCGFADQSHLTRTFKRHFGLTPGQYRNFVQNM